MNLESILKEFDLNKKEASIYLASLELGTAPANKIAQKAQIERTNFYSLARKLIKIGLLKESRRGKKRMFIALEPERLFKIQEQKLEKLKQSLPQLKAIHNTVGQKPKIFYHEGLNGIRQTNQEILKHNGEHLVFTTPRFETKDQRKISQELIQERVENKNKARLIGEICEEMIETKKRDKKELRETRMLPREIFNSEVEIGVHGNKVSIVDYKEEFGFIIEGTEIAKTLKMIFEIVWNSGRVVE